MASVTDHLPARDGGHDRSPAARGTSEEHQQQVGLRQQIADGRWQLYALEVLILIVMFGWMAVTNVAAGGHGPL
jgi:hypothetical protein